jgi:leader peptidase (prepilin peptidase)/N-methyltransferase
MVTALTALPALPWICAAILAAGLLALSWIDLRTGYLPDSLQIVLALAAVVVVIVGSPIGITWQHALAGAVLNGGMFWGLRWIVSRLKGREAMGFGDVKLVAVGGLWLGPWGLPWIMLVGGLSTLVGAGIVGAITRKPVWQGEMPLGPGLAAGIFGCFVAALCQVPWLRLAGP